MSDVLASCSPFVEGAGAEPTRRPAPFVCLPVTGGFETRVDPDIAELLAGQRLYLAGGKYASFVRARKLIYLHQCVAGAALHGEVDHMNGDPLDNRRCNLRVVSHSRNQLNRHGPARSASGFRGVTPCRPLDRWRCALYWHGRSHCVATWREPVIAALARDDCVRRVTGCEDGLNFPFWPPRPLAEELLSTASETVVLWFVKRGDGSIRRMMCRSAADVPEDRRRRDATLGLVTVLDLEANEARCVPVKGLLCLRYKNHSFRVVDAFRAAA